MISIKTFVLRWRWTITTVLTIIVIGTGLFLITHRWDAFLVPVAFFAIAFLRVWDRKRRT